MCIYVCSRTFLLLTLLRPKYLSKLGDNYNNLGLSQVPSLTKVSFFQVVLRRFHRMVLIADDFNSTDTVERTDVLIVKLAH